MVKKILKIKRAAEGNILLEKGTKSGCNGWTTDYVKDNSFESL